MARIFKIQGFYIDPNDDYDAESLKVALEEDYDLISLHIKIKEKDVGEWYDEILLNNIDCPYSECEKYFKEYEMNG